MVIHFGLSFDDSFAPGSDQAEMGVYYIGPKRLLQLLEQLTGQAGHEEEVAHLRTEQFRQVILKHQEQHPSAFYSKAFTADQFATAADLLNRRDELKVSGWDFKLATDLPPRLLCLAQIEEILQNEAGLPDLYPGEADRLVVLMEELSQKQLDIQQIFVHEPLELLPIGWRRLMAAFVAQGYSLQAISSPNIDQANTDLGQLRKCLMEGQNQKPSLKADGSILVLKAKTETEIGAFMAKICKHNDYAPLLLITDKDPNLDNALIMEGLPSIGTPSTSLARPSLQVLKLVTTFLWDPIDIYKVMEFVSLRNKPLDDDLANALARILADRPGLGSDAWRSAVSRYFAELESGKYPHKAKNIDQIRQQYFFWFQRDRYDRNGEAPKDRIIEIFAYLHRWARNLFDEGDNENQSLLVLSEQSRRIVDLLEALPEISLGPLEVERIVRTIYEPAPAQFREQEQDSLASVYQPAAIMGPVPNLVWWNFVQSDPDYFFSPWYKHESEYLDKVGIELETPECQNQRRVWQRKRPILQCQDQLILCLPQQVNGSAVNPHPLLGDLEALYHNLAPISLDLDKQETCPAWEKAFQLPDWQKLKTQQIGKPQAFFKLQRPSRLSPRESETFSSLSSLFYYPYQYILRHKVKLKKNAILSVVKDRTLMGNLAHRFLEEVLAADNHSWSKADTHQYIDQIAPDLLRREGATLLAYGREPSRINLLNRVKHAAWVLLSHIRENNWQITEAEKRLEGYFENVHLNGRADLVLHRDGGQQAIVDLKWSSGRFYENKLRNGEDLQLILYGQLLSQGKSWPHTAYFIISKGDMIARNTKGFQQSSVVETGMDAEDLQEIIFERMRATFDWRREQLDQGLVEIRCSQTYEELEDYYGNQLMDLLEMRAGDAPFDDYRSLINLVE